MQLQTMMIKMVLALWLFSNLIMAKDYVLLVGVGEFQNSTLFPKFDVQQDIEKMKNSIGQRLDSNHTIVELVNEKATKANILSTLRDIAHKVTQNDKVYFYYTGHGISHNDSIIWKYLRKLDRNERGFLVGTSAILPYDFDENNIRDSIIVGSKEFAPIIRQIDEKTYESEILLDACFSSLLARGERLEADFRGKKDKKYKNTTIISSTNRTSSGSKGSRMSDILSKCPKNKSFKECIKKSKSSDSFRVK